MRPDVDTPARRLEAALAETIPEAKPVFDDAGEQIGLARFKDGRWVMEVSS